MIISRPHLMRRIISSVCNNQCGFLSGENKKNCSYLKTAAIVIKKPPKWWILDESKLVHLFGFMLEDNSLINVMRAFPSRVRCHHDKLPIPVAGWVRQYLLEHQLTIPIISLIRLSHDSILKPKAGYQCSEISTWVCSGKFYYKLPWSQRVKLVCYRQLIDHTITKL